MLLFSRVPRGATGFIALCDGERDRRGQTVSNYADLGRSSSHSGPRSFPGLNKIVVFDDLRVVKETAHYRELPKRLKVILV